MKKKNGRVCAFQFTGEEHGEKNESLGFINSEHGSVVVLYAYCEM